MKKISLIVIGLCAISTAIAGSTKWIYGHGTDAHHEFYKKELTDESRDIASEPNSDPRTPELTPWDDDKEKRDGREQADPRDD